MLSVRKSPIGGRSALGVFADRPFGVGETIEVAYVIIIPRDESRLLATTSLDSYIFQWGGGCTAVALGLGSLYNHSYTPNAQYHQDTRNRQLEFTAISPISAGEEITINYNGNPESRAPIWFDVRDQVSDP